MAGATPFVRTGNVLVVGLMLGVLGLALVLGRHRRADA
jgi:hypothetical protein